MEGGNVLGFSAENAAGSVLCENDLVSVDEHFNGITAVDVEVVADLDRNNDSSKIIDLSYHSG